MNSVNRVEEKVLAHKIVTEGRKHTEISGVREVVSFDDLSAVLKTGCGELTIEGKELSVNTLDTEKGIVILDGKIDGIFYSDENDRQRKGLFGRLKG